MTKPAPVSKGKKRKAAEEAPVDDSPDKEDNAAQVHLSKAVAQAAIGLAKRMTCNGAPLALKLPVGGDVTCECYLLDACWRLSNSNTQ